MCDNDNKWKFCDKCGSKKVVADKEPICPKCSGLNIITKDEALNIYEQLSCWFNPLLTTMINSLDKKGLIYWLLEERVILAGFFWNRYPTFNLTRLFTLNDLLKRAFKAYNVKGNEKADFEKAMQLIDQYSSVIDQVEIRRYLIEEGYAHCVLKKPIDLQNIKQSKSFINDLISSFSYYLDIDYINLQKSLELNMILSNEDTRKYLNEHKEEYENINNDPKETVVYTIEQMIHNNYFTLKSLRDILTLTTLFAEFFDIRYLKEKNIPIEVFSTIADCPLRQDGMLLYMSRTEFIGYIAEKHKDVSAEDIYDSLVCSEKNYNIFPFLEEIEGNVYISPNFMDLMKLYYTPIYHRKLFENEVQERSLQFESIDVPYKLKDNGFEVKNDIKDRKNSTLQIDSITRKGNKVYVVETKQWDIGKLFVRQKTNHLRERDLKGVINGYKYRMKNGIIIVREEPSLLSKIDYVKTNLKTIYQDHERITSVEGLIITRSYPPISEYKGVKILSIEDISTL